MVRLILGDCASHPSWEFLEFYRNLSHTRSTIWGKRPYYRLRWPQSWL